MPQSGRLELVAKTRGTLQTSWKIHFLSSPWTQASPFLGRQGCLHQGYGILKEKVAKYISDTPVYTTARQLEGG